ncbi:hypothetical protein SLEP1_g57955 [Rubroshorea leprosula]|uniref:Uncharacterized protein n=1 Tax=Rubroshorea leprosula TaxID=152421 RepID=A0AAV5MP32_9ROSI|nr:hypothetical protein SLEP1_g57955 [Rubroshorea leprosula]
MPDPISDAVVAKVVENIVDRILDFILNPITVVRKCNENVENLKNQVDKLKDQKKLVENYEADIRRRGEIIDDTVQTWLTKADEFIKAAGEPVRVGDEFAKEECFFRLCPNLIPRYKLSRKAQKNSQNIVQHLEEAARFGALPFSRPPPLQQDVAAFVEGFEEFLSRMAVLKQIMEALKSPTVNKIGVHGTSGVGKTMLVKMVKGIAKQGSLFTAVLMAKVTKNPDLKSIQRDIARDLGMDLLPTELPPEQVADRIRAKLIEKKKFLCLHVQNAPDIRGIFNPARRLLHSQVFPMLEVLTLSNLPKMEKICHGLTGAAPFKVLSKITVVGCHQLKNLFSFSMARQLQLQEITVQNCRNIAEIIDDVEEQGNGNDIVEESEGCKLGNNLRSLTLTKLPELISFFNGGNCSGISLFNDKVFHSFLLFYFIFCFFAEG